MDGDNEGLSPTQTIILAHNGDKTRVKILIIAVLHNSSRCKIKLPEGKFRPVKELS